MLKFVGKQMGLEGIPGIPARDISADELNERKEEWAELLELSPNQVEKALIRSGAYKKIRKRKGGE